MQDNKIKHHLFVRENKTVSFSGETLEKVRSLIRRYPEGRQKSALLPVLHIAQEELGGYLSVDSMDYVASLLNLNPMEVYEVATFYSMFYLDKVGKYVLEVCHTGPCAICGGEEVLQHIKDYLHIETGETTSDGMFTLKEVECLGACGSGPAMQVNTEFYEHMTARQVEKVIEDLRQKPEEEGSSKGWAEQFS
ncbi:MAG: NAD(P)H-dependent oxidoreductase subunit E [Bacteroidetes bacterium]|nr:NAD(P)H-dependent oxidoreductase subunit E [Bacteroidota bacterium]